jgi:hypothetical protein
MWRCVSLVEQEPLILPKHMCSPPVFSGFVFLDLSFLKCFVHHWLHFFLLAIPLPDLLRFTASDYIFDNIANNSMSTILITVFVQGLAPLNSALNPFIYGVFSTMIVVSYGRYTHVFAYTVNQFEFVLTSMKETNMSIMYSHHTK